MRQTKSFSESSVLKSPRTETQEANLQGSPTHYVSCESSRAIENTWRLSSSKTTGELMVRGARPHFAGRETFGCIVTNSLGFVSDAILYIMLTGPGNKTSYPESRPGRGCCRSLFVL